MDWSLKYINSCVFYKGKGLSYMSIYEYRNYKDSTFYFLGRSHYGAKQVGSFAGYYGMALLSKVGLGGSNQYFGCWKFCKPNCLRWTFNK